MSFILFKKTVPHPTNQLLQVEFEAHEEHASVTGHFDNEEDVRLVLKEIKAGKDSAWFCAKVFVRVIGTDVTSNPDYLGCCSYPSFEEFMEAGDYFTDMVDTATNDLMSNLESEIKNCESTLNMLNQLKGSK